MEMESKAVGTLYGEMLARRKVLEYPGSTQQRELVSGQGY